MRKRPTPTVEAKRITDGPWGSTPDFGCTGAFSINHLRIIASDGHGWDHVSVSCADRCPTWEEMCWVKRQFFRDDETVLQYHPEQRLYVNHHPYCLHLCRPQKEDVPLPPTWMIGPLRTPLSTPLTTTIPSTE